MRSQREKAHAELSSVESEDVEIIFLLIYWG